MFEVISKPVVLIAGSLGERCGALVFVNVWFFFFLNMDSVRFVFALHEAGEEAAEPAGVLVVLAGNGAPSGRGFGPGA